MADEIDLAQERETMDRDNAILSVASRAKLFEPGFAGECDLCGEYFKRLVFREFDGAQVGACGGCRDRMGLA